MFERTVKWHSRHMHPPSSSSLPSPQQHVSLSGILRSCALRFLRCSTRPVINEATSRYQMQWLPVCMVLVRNCSCAHSETMLIATLSGNKAFTHLPAHLRLTRPWALGKELDDWHARLQFGKDKRWIWVSMRSGAVRYLLSDVCMYSDCVGGILSLDDDFPDNIAIVGEYLRRVRCDKQFWWRMSRPDMSWTCLPTISRPSFRLGRAYISPSWAKCGNNSWSLLSRNLLGAATP